MLLTSSGSAPASTTWVANKDFGELELRTSPNFRTSFFVEIANFTELQNFFQQFSKNDEIGQGKKATSGKILNLWAVHEVKHIKTTD